MNSCCTTLQTHVRIGIDLLCFQGEIDACSLDIGMKIDTFVDCFSTWINLPHLKIVHIHIKLNNNYLKSFFCVVL